MGHTLDDLKQIEAVIACIDLGPGWEYKPSPQSDEYPNHLQLGRLVHSGYGAEIHFGTIYNKLDTLHVSGNYPRDSKGTYSAPSGPEPSIHLSWHKEPKAIAKDIERRLLPAYMERLSKVIQRNNEREAYLDAKSASGRELATQFSFLKLADYARGVIGDHNRHHNGSDKVKLSNPFTMNGPRIEVECLSDNIHIELGNLSLHQAKALLIVLGHFVKGGKA